MADVLENLKILDFTTLLAGPFATMYLADMGAHVLRIISGSRPDFIRSAPPFIPDTDIFAADAQLNRNKQCICLNLKDDRAMDIIHRLVEEYDIIIESFRPGVMSRLKMDYDRMKKINPAIIYCSLSGYGQTGPLKYRAGHDINFVARSGIASYSGKKTIGPCLGGVQNDLAAGSMNAVIGIMTAVIYRNTTGKGQYIDISITDGMMAFTALYGTTNLVDGKDPELEGGMSYGGSLYDYYKTKDGKYISIASIEPKFFSNFCKVINRPDLIPGGIEPDEIHRVKKEIQDIFLKKNRDEWMILFDSTDACVEPVLTLSEALTSLQATEREMVVELSLAQGGTVRQVAHPIKFSQLKPVYKKPHFAIQSGIHTREVCRSIGYSEEQIETFEKTGLFS
ncbi:MAG: CaiB/BaiF CoA-transferase family protein [Desulfobacterium sp.]